MISLEPADAVLNALACQQGQAERLRQVVNDPLFDSNAANSAGLTPLKAAVMAGGLDEVRILLDAGAVVTCEIQDFAKRSYPHKPEVGDILAAARARAAAEAALEQVKNDEAKR